MVQGGDPTGTGSGGESIYGRQFKDEPHRSLRFSHRGLLACANENAPDTNGSQFFLTLGEARHLDGKHTIFGRVAGKSIFVLAGIGETAVDGSDRPLEAPRLKAVEVLDSPFHDIVPRALARRPAGPDGATDGDGDGLGGSKAGATAGDKAGRTGAFAKRRRKRGPSNLTSRKSSGRGAAFDEDGDEDDDGDDVHGLGPGLGLANRFLARGGITSVVDSSALPERRSAKRERPEGIDQEAGPAAGGELAAAGRMPAPAAMEAATGVESFSSKMARRMASARSEDDGGGSGVVSRRQMHAARRVGEPKADAAPGGGTGFGESLLAAYAGRKGKRGKSRQADTMSRLAAFTSTLREVSKGDGDSEGGAGEAEAGGVGWAAGALRFTGPVEQAAQSEGVGAVKDHGPRRSHGSRGRGQGRARSEGRGIIRGRMQVEQR